MTQGRLPWGRGLVGGAWGLVVCLTLGSCSSMPALIEKPRVTSVAMTVVGIDARKADLRFTVQVENPTPVSLTLAGYDYDLQIEGRPFLTGMSQVKHELKAGEVTAVPIPVSVKFAELFEKLPLFLGRTDVVCNLAVALTVKTSAGEFRLPFQKEERLPLWKKPPLRFRHPQGSAKGST